MDEQKESQQPQEQGYVPRPAWQVWGARLAALIFIGLVALQIIGIARGGL